MTKGILTILAFSLAGGSLAAENPSLSAPEIQRIKSEQSSRVEASKVRIHDVFTSNTREDGYEFRPLVTRVDEYGQTHVRFSQFFNGVKIWGAEGITHMDHAGEFRRETLAVHSRVSLNTQPTLSASEALAIVHERLAPKGPYAIEPITELVIYPESELVIHRFRTPEPKIPNALEAERVVKGYRLAYHIHVQLDNAQDKLTHRDYMVDAQSGRIIDDWDTLQTYKKPKQQYKKAEGIGYSQYSGMVDLDTTKTKTGFELRDTGRPSKPHPKTKADGNIVYNADNKKTNETGTIYTDPDNTWGDGLNYSGTSTTDSNGQTAAVDAAYGTQVTWDFLSKVLDRDGIDDLGSAVYSRVHQDKNYENAFWSKDCFCMTYGDGKAKGFSVLTALDVIGHEMGHGVNNFSADLIYKNESGGLNEANSDIIGTMVEFYERGGGYVKQSRTIPDKGGNWLIGEQLSQQPLRTMFKPSKDKRSPDFWMPGIGDIDVHFSGGPMNRAFFFMSQGATTAGDTAAPDFLPKGMKGIGNTNATKIWYQALTNYLPKNSTYRDARYACLRAAEDIQRYQRFNGRRITQDDAIDAVLNAFAAVNVGWPAEKMQDWEAPTIESVLPSSNTGMIRLDATVVDDTKVALVEFWINDEFFGSATQGKENVYSLTLDASQLPNGNQRIQIKAYDQDGNAAYYPEDKNAFEKLEIKNSINNRVANGGLELGHIFWNNANVLFDKKKENAFGGNGSVVLGGLGKSGYTYIYQSSPDAVTGSKATLSFQALTTTSETSSTADDKLMVYLLDKNASGPEKMITTLSNLDASTGFVKKEFSLDMANLKDGFTLVFESTENTEKPTSWRVDDITLSVE